MYLLYGLLTFIVLFCIILLNPFIEVWVEVVIKMRELKEIIETINRHRQVLEEKYKVKNIAIFGSYSRNEQTRESDIDILVEFKEPVGFLFIHLADFLEEILQMKVDLLTPDAIKPNRKEYIMKDIVYV